MDNYKYEDIDSFLEEENNFKSECPYRDAEMIPMFLGCLSSLEGNDINETLEVILRSLQGATKEQTQSYFTAESIIQLCSMLTYEDQSRSNTIIKIISTAILKSKEIKSEYTYEEFQHFISNFLNSDDQRNVESALGFISAFSMVNSAYTIRYLQNIMDISNLFTNGSAPPECPILGYAPYIISYLYFSLHSLIEMEPPPYEWIFFTAKTFIVDTWPSPLCTQALEVFRQALDDGIEPILEMMREYNDGEIGILINKLLFSSFKEQTVMALEVAWRMAYKISGAAGEACFIPPCRFSTLISLAEKRISVGAMKLMRACVSRRPGFAGELCGLCGEGGPVGVLFRRCERGFPEVRAECLRTLAALALSGAADFAPEAAARFLRCLAAVADPVSEGASECVRAAAQLMERISREEAADILGEMPLDDFEGIDEECDAAVQSIRSLFE